MIGLKRKNKNYLLIEKWNEVQDTSDKKGKNKVKTEKKTLENEKEVKEEEKKEKRRALVLVNEDGLKEQKVEASFYDDIDFAYLFKDNIVLKDI